MDLHDVCKRAAAKPLLRPPRPVIREKGYLKSNPLPDNFCRFFSEWLEEATRSWSSPLSAKNLIQGGLVLDWVGMEEKGFSHLPLVKPLLASHLHPLN